jgi:hypothetical protein
LLLIALVVPVLLKLLSGILWLSRSAGPGLCQNPGEEANAMLGYNLDNTSGILTLEPKSPLTVADFKALAAHVTT